ncbi:MAG: hypothetical protein AB1894_15885 [Chloroflexota bacterium]
MDLIQLIQIITTLASAIAAVLAWCAKIAWSKEFAIAKNETIKAKEAEIKARDAFIATLEREINSLRELSPMKIREYFVSVMSQLEEYNEKLKEDLKQAREDVSAMEQNISSLSKDMARSEETITSLQLQKKELEFRVNTLEKRSQNVDTAYENISTISGAYNAMTARYPELLESTRSPFLGVGQIMGQAIIESNPEIAASLKKVGTTVMEQVNSHKNLSD